VVARVCDRCERVNYCTVEVKLYLSKSLSLFLFLSLQGANILLTERGDVKLGRFEICISQTHTHTHTRTHTCFFVVWDRVRVCVNEHVLMITDG